jgi:hypothetical protein
MAFQFIKKLNAKIVQLVECFLPKEEVASSSLVLRLFQIFFVWCLMTITIFSANTCVSSTVDTCPEGYHTPIKIVSNIISGVYCCPDGSQNKNGLCVKDGYNHSATSIVGTKLYCKNGYFTQLSTPNTCCPSGTEIVGYLKCRSSDGVTSDTGIQSLGVSDMPGMLKAKQENVKTCPSGCKDDANLEKFGICDCYSYGEVKDDKTCNFDGKLVLTSSLSDGDKFAIIAKQRQGNPQVPITNGEYCTNQAIDAYTRNPVEGEYAKCLACMGGNAGAEGSTTGYTYTAGQCFGSSIDTLPTSIARFVVGLGIGLLFIKITMAGLSLLLGNDSPQKLKETKEEIFAIITAFIFLSMGLIVLRYIGYDILKLGDFLPSGF